MIFLETVIYAVMVRTYFYFEETGRTNSFERFPYLRTLTERLTDDALELWERREGIQATRYFELLRSIGDGEDVDPVIHTALDLCLAVTCVPEFAVYLNYYTGNTATVQFAFELEGNTFPTHEAIVDRLRRLQKICRIDWQKVPLSCAAVEADHRLLAYLFGEESTDGEIRAPRVFGGGEWFLSEEPLHPMFVHQELAAECAEWLGTRTSRSVLQIAGAGGGRFLAKHIARQLGQNLFLVPAEACKDFFSKAAEERKGELLRELFWQKGMLCLYGLRAQMYEQWQVTEEDFWKKVMELPCVSGTDFRNSLV